MCVRWEVIRIVLESRASRSGPKGTGVQDQRLQRLRINHDLYKPSVKNPGIRSTSSPA